MPITPVLILLGAAVLANLALMALIIVPPMLGRASPVARADEPAIDSERRAAQAAVVGGITGPAADDGVPTQTYDRVVRIVAWVFILTASVIVVATGLWPETQAAILVLLALSGLFVVTIHDLLIETVCEDNDALLTFLADRLRAIDGVRDTETFVYLRLVKQTYQYGTR